MNINTQALFETIEDHIQEVIEQSSPLGAALWEKLLDVHPADIAQFLNQIERDFSRDLFLRLPFELRTEVFSYFSDSMKIYALSLLSDNEATELFNQLPVDQITDLFDSFSDQELKRYITLLSTQDRQRVLSLLSFDPESAGGIMDTDVLTLRQDFTVEKSIQVLQRLQPRSDLHRQIYVTSQDNQLIGHVNLEDLVLNHPQARLHAFLRKNELIVSVDEDREQIAKDMIHYHLMMVPVVGENNYFLGVIPSETLVDIIEQEASEDVYKMSAMTPIKNPYFDTAFVKILYERSYILILLLLAQSLSTMILRSFEATLCGFYMLFITMLTSTGGNSSSQTSALVIQGMASGDINPLNIWRFLRREILMALTMAFLLGVVAFIRVYLTYGVFMGSLVVSISLSLIVLMSVILGSGIPLLLKRFNFDPAFAAGPFLATIMDILGLLIYAYISKLFYP